MDERTKFSNQQASYDTINETGADSKTISKVGSGRIFDGREEIDVQTCEAVTNLEDDEKSNRDRSKRNKIDCEPTDDGGIKGDELRFLEQLTSDFIRTGETAVHCGARSSTVEGSKNNNAVDIAVYKRRWYILFVFGLVCFITGGVWNTWGPIAISVEPALGWTNANIAVVSICGCLSSSLSAPAFAWVMDVKGRSEIYFSAHISNTGIYFLD